MEKSQANLLRNFPRFMTALEKLPGGLPNVHIAVVSSDMGAGRRVMRLHARRQERDLPVHAPRGACTATNLEPGATFISNIGGVANYTGNLADVFTCIAALGEDGLRLRAPVRRDHARARRRRAGRAAENQGFLRPDAYLAIVMITNEDDCSAAAGVPLFDTSATDARRRSSGRRATSAATSSVTSATARPRAASRRATPSSDTVSYATASRPRDRRPADGRRHRRADQGAQARSGQPDHRRRDHRPGGAVQRALEGAAERRHRARGRRSRTRARPPTAASPTRRSAPASSSQQFGANGLLLSICDADFAPALQRHRREDRATASSSRASPARSRSGRAPSVPDCTVVSHTRTSGDGRSTRPSRRAPTPAGPARAGSSSPGEGTLHRPEVRDQRRSGRPAGHLPGRHACSARCAWRACPTRPAGARSARLRCHWSANLSCARLPTAIRGRCAQGAATAPAFGLACSGCCVQCRQERRAMRSLTVRSVDASFVAGRSLLAVVRWVGLAAAAPVAAGVHVAQPRGADP